MALKSTVYKANLSIADIDHSYYADHNLTLARHPSETDDRMMIRLVALALNAWQLQDLCNGDGTLGFGIGLSRPRTIRTCTSPTYTGQKRLWIEVGQPEEKPITKACNKSDHVIVYPFNHAANVWWKGAGGQRWAAKASCRCTTSPPRWRRTGQPGRAQHAAASHHPGRPADPVQRQGHRVC